MFPDLTEVEMRGIPFALWVGERVMRRAFVELAGLATMCSIRGATGMVFKNRLAASFALMVVLHSCGPSPLAQTSSVRFSPEAERVDRTIQQEMQSHQIPGLQMTVVQHGRIVFSGFYGLANVENSVPVTKQTIFRINSMSKAFTGVASMQLVEAGKLSLDAPLSRYLEGLPASWQTITVRQILTHTSGLPEIADDNVHFVGDGTADGAWKAVQTLPLQFTPGTQFIYTQTNYVVMGKIITKLTGESFASFVQRRQFAVAGMDDTSYGDSTDVTPHVASLYTYLRLLTKGTQTTGVEKSTVLHARFEALPESMRPAAGIQTTSNDLAKWVIALQEGRLLKKSSLDELWSPQQLKDGSYGGFSDEVNGYALGWPVMRRTAHRAITPVGGERSSMFIYPTDDLTVVVLTDLMGASPQTFIDRIASVYISGLQTKAE